MALEDILRAMEQQAQAEIACLQAQAEAEAAAIIAQAEAEVRTIKVQHLANIAPRVQQERAQLLSEAKLLARRELLVAREALLEEAFAAAHTALASLREQPAYPHYLTQLLREVVEELGDELCLIVDARDEAIVRRIAADLGIPAGIAIGLHTVGGLEACTPDGGVTVINTIEARLQRSRRPLRRTVAAILKAEDVSWKVIMAMPTPASEP
ncbi:MAG TPA: V-type ATP synthase subunit E [Alphaproteobacteria bacterium]|nr:V-type ATP synthase subunit E [Alphaproteobacteria bacterium]